MPAMLMTTAAARHLITSRHPDMTIEVATRILEEAAVTATQLDERTETGELLFDVPDLGGRLIVKDKDPDYEYVCVAFIRDRNKPKRGPDPAEVEAAKAVIKASVEGQRSR